MSGGQVANVINNFYSGQIDASPKGNFEEDKLTPITFSIGCKNLDRGGELLASISSGHPTPFLSAPDGQNDGIDPKAT